MSLRLAALTTSLVVLASGCLVMIGAAESGSDPIPAAVSLAESTVPALQVAANTTQQYATGAVIGTGIGIIAGSTVTFAYWRQKLE